MVRFRVFLFLGKFKTTLNRHRGLFLFTHLACCTSYYNPANTKKSFLQYGLLHQEMRSYENEFPCCLQVDTEDEFKSLDHLSSLPEFQQLVHLSPSYHVAVKKVCIISNKQDFERDYSQFVDSCDTVMRINKMDNIDSGLTGSRTDVAFVSCCSEYFVFSARERHLDVLRQVPEIYFNSEEVNFHSREIDVTTQFTQEEGIKNWQFIPTIVHRSTPNFTTLSKGFCLADYLYPEAQIYYLGDVDSFVRTPESTKHPHDIETAYLQSLVRSGRVVPICEELELDHYTYSRDTTLKSRLINVVHPEWEDQLQIVGGRGVLRHSDDAATILEYTSESVFLKWDTRGVEYFKKTAAGTYTLQQKPLKKVGFLRILNEENTIIPCLLSVAELFDIIVILWSPDTTDDSIALAKKWEARINKDYHCQLLFIHYPHHVAPPHSVDDLCALPLENQVGTYYNYGMDAIKKLYPYEPYLMVKIDGDQIYFTEEFDAALRHVSSTDACMSVCGYNTAVHHHAMGLYKARPLNGGRDHLICGSDNLPCFITAAPYEVDRVTHSKLVDYPNPCWMHFMSTKKYDNVICSFEDDELSPISSHEELLEKYRKYILPLLKKAESPYYDLQV